MKYFASSLIRKAAFSGLALSAVASLQAQVVVAPTAFTSTEGNGTFSASPFGSSAQTTQTLIEQSQLGLNVGDTITGITFRLDSAAGSTYPTADAVYSNYQISIGKAATTAETISGTLAANFNGTPTVVRSGALTLSANTYPNGSSPNNPGPFIPFTTPFTYNGGDLVFEIRASGAPNGFIPVDTDNNTASGYGATYKTIFALSAGATTASTIGIGTPIQELAVTPVPEPAAWAFGMTFGLGALAFVRKMRS